MWTRNWLVGIWSVTVASGYELPINANLVWTQATPVESTKKQMNKNRFEFYLRLMDLFTKLEIFRLEGHVSSNIPCAMSRFHDRLSSRFPWIACLRGPALGFIAMHHVGRVGG